MIIPKINIERISNYFTAAFREPKSTRLFFKILLGYTLVKIVLLWPVSRTAILYHSPTLPKSLKGKLILAPTFLAAQNIDVFFIVAIIFLLLALFVNSSVVVNLLFFWLTLNLYVVNLSLSNGSDIVLFMLSLWCIPMVCVKRGRSEQLHVSQKAVYNLALLFCQLQVVFIYLVSGMDKLVSETWRSGEAFDYIRHLEDLYNPILPAIFGNNLWNRVFSLTTILFELVFVVLVWSNRFRIPILLVGTFFHLFIWIVLSLPDFAFVMIVSYFIFLRDSDYDRIKSWVRPLLP